MIQSGERACKADKILRVGGRVLEMGPISGMVDQNPRSAGGAF
jgi:hypothetical protein